MFRVVRGAKHRGDRAFEGAQDLAHADVDRRARQLVAAARTTGTDDEPGVAQACDKLLEVRPRQVLFRGDLGERGGA
jgi:hypothetical protein